jgi:hypothetical protein
VRRYGIIGGEHDDVLKLVKKLQAAHPGTLLKFCYEAGPRGFALCRCLRSHGLDCLLVCPSKVPRKPGERVKTDRRGRERDGSPPPPAPLTGRQPTHNHRMKSFGASAPDARPPKTGAPLRRGSRRSFEWIACGYTALSFWTATNRSSSRLEDRLWLRPMAPALTGPTESE